MNVLTQISCHEAVPYVAHVAESGHIWLSAADHEHRISVALHLPLTDAVAQARKIATALLEAAAAVEQWQATHEPEKVGASC